MFQIPLQFYRAFEEIETFDGNGEKYHYLFNFFILITILFVDD